MKRVPHSYDLKAVRVSMFMLVFTGQFNCCFVCFSSAVTEKYLIRKRIVCQKLRKPTTVVIDNSPLHTSAAFQSKIPAWESQGLYFWFLPAYCPELNLIEILWQKIKYQWLSRDAYESFAKLDEALCEILAGIGDQYEIVFHE